MTPARVSRVICDHALRSGFHRVGIARIDAPTRYQEYRSWLAAGYAGSMSYLTATHQLSARRDPRELAEQAHSVVTVAVAYPPEPGCADASSGPVGFIARFARGTDYHDLVRQKLRDLTDALADDLGRAVTARPCVDSAPVLERDFSVATGIGFTGKNTMLIVPGLGSYTVLGELLIDVEAEPTAPLTRSSCGQCRICLDACPTGAFEDEFLLDSRKCISYLTIEYRGVIPRALRPAMGNMIFGCDLCQETCPYNAAAPARTAPAPELAPLSDDRGTPDLLSLLELGTNQLRRFLGRTALRRIGRSQLVRNVCVALGNSLDPRAQPALCRALRDREPLVRGHAAWALARFGDTAALERALAAETDPYVRAELRLALAEVAERTAATA